MTAIPTDHGRSIRVVLVALALAVPWLLATADGTIKAAPTPPPHTTSRYMRTIDPTILYNEGCSQGSAAENGVVVLFFGQPWYNGSVYGANLFDGAATFASVYQIEQAVEAFTDGYWDCSPSWPYIRLVVGTSNYQGSTNYGHGQAWAQMVNRIAAYINTPQSYASQISVGGGNDMELNWNTPTATRAWADGYASASIYPYYNFGACEGCPTNTYYWWTPDNGWTVDDVWYVSWGSPPSNPLPQIYATSGINADQWQYISLHGYNNYGARINLKGSLSQYQACLDQGSPCSGINNTPNQAWSQLWDALNADSRTAQPLEWSTEITFQN